MASVSGVDIGKMGNTKWVEPLVSDLLQYHGNICPGRALPRGRQCIIIGGRKAWVKEFFYIPALYWCRKDKSLVIKIMSDAYYVDSRSVLGHTVMLCIQGSIFDVIKMRFHQVHESLDDVLKIVSFVCC